MGYGSQKWSFTMTVGALCQVTMGTWPNREIDARFIKMKIRNSTIIELNPFNVDFRR